jgi:gliding motility-associated-like protein
MLTTSAGTITGNISVTSSGAATKTVALSGTVSPLATGGSISGTGPVIYGSSSGTMTLSGYIGTIIRWEKKLGSGSWNAIANTSTTYSENPAFAGTWYYRAVISSGACPNAYSSEFTLTVSQKELTVTGAASTSKVYDGNTVAAITGGTLSGIVGSDVVTLTNNTTGIFASSGVGTSINVTSAMTLSGAAAGNYYLTQPPLSANITVKTLTVTGSTATNKTYDGNATASVTGGTLSGIVGSDVVSLENNTSGVFASAGAGTGISVTTVMTISGTSSGNYILTQPTLTANITAKTLTVINATADNKLYDGTITAIVTGATLSGIVGSDDVTLANSTTGTFATSTVGTAKTVTSAMTLSGAASGSYTLVQPALSANITAKTLTVTGASANNKVYDGNTNAIITGGELTGVVGSDAVTLLNNTAGTFASPNTGSGYLVTTAMTLSGADAGNYTLTQPALFADITNKLLTVTGATVSNKEYDGNTFAAITGGTLSGLVGSASVTLANNTTGKFATANAGTAIPVTTFMTIEGADAGLYTLVQPSLTADISPKTLTATADDKNKVMGRSNPVLTISYTGFITGEDASFITEPAASTTAVTNSTTGVYPIILSGGSSGNYILSLVNGVLTVDKAVLTITADNKSKIYGSENPELTLSYSGFVNGDDASAITPPVAATTALSGSAVGTYPITLTGGSASTYTLTLADGTMIIGKAVLTITANNLSKVYGSVNPVLTLSYTGFVNGDNESVLSIKPALATSANTSSVTGTYSIMPSGGAADNYSLSYVNGSLTIAKKMLTVTAENKYRVFNLPDPAFTMTFSGFVLSEGVAVITTLPVAQTTAILSSPAGLYPIIPAGGFATNYDFTYLNGTLLISSIAGDTNGDGVISGTEIAGDTNGDGIISGSELTGDTNGNGSIDGTEVSGDINGDGIIGSGESRLIDPQKDYPNINHLFTPNNDGINDYWILPDLDKYGISDVKVYNRWGKLVYSNKHYDNQWDGTSNGAKLPDGAYYFIIKTEKAGIISGTVNILR